MPTLPFARLPSAPLPGSSYYISNALIIAKRVALGLEDPVRIEFDGEWKKGDALFDWYQRHSRTTIESMQLRKEQKAPFFHEYVTFRLSDGTCFRIDRRQLPDERSPMGCTQHEGVEAYDTIEQIADLEDSMYNASLCLVQLDFTVNVELNLIIGICRAIYERPDTRNYTVQRYNCYFYSQTIVMCTLCTVYEWDEYYIWGPRNLQQEIGDALKVRMPLEALDKDPDISIKISNKQTQPQPGRVIISDPTQSNRPQTEHIPVRKTLFGVFRSTHKGGRPRPMQELDIGDFQRYLSGKIRAHGIRVEQYKFLLRSNAGDVERGIKLAMDCMWLYGRFVK
ncbi:unnamed protein product [Rhizoctonia solani]|uniref:Uncharacterized protein n=1 Tax=Rhizoctonia solani TaxID=456999 RepID=A0A8H3HEF1_9AGAM|nr:unnamed protein product [Rhizoctonia solani]